MQTTDYQAGYNTGFNEGCKYTENKVKELQAQLARLQQAYEARKVLTHAMMYGIGYSRYTVDAHGVVTGAMLRDIHE